MQAKGDENIENLDEIAASRVKYTLPGPMTILDCIKGQLISNSFFSKVHNWLIETSSVCQSFK